MRRGEERQSPCAPDAGCKTPPRHASQVTAHGIAARLHKQRRYPRSCHSHCFLGQPQHERLDRGPALGRQPVDLDQISAFATSGESAQCFQTFREWFLNCAECRRLLALQILSPKIALGHETHQLVTAFRFTYRSSGHGQLLLADICNGAELHRPWLAWKLQFDSQTSPVGQADLDFVDSLPLRHASLHILPGQTLNLFKTEQLPGYAQASQPCGHRLILLKRLAQVQSYLQGTETGRHTIGTGSRVSSQHGPDPPPQISRNELIITGAGQLLQQPEKLVAAPLALKAIPMCFADTTPRRLDQRQPSLTCCGHRRQLRVHGGPHCARSQHALPDSIG
ncbi:hypothetical protein WR25_17529 [Diploscapter pachys]|uniref:Uncharacterized protein n=1 Tax=Diploscapter pachys TaxID=2018661 RepID=A0A2A2KCR3_9BILA|nr:hypothetical protein WR25_17529 [Diploscapter pachys]